MSVSVVSCLIVNTHSKSNEVCHTKGLQLGVRVESPL